MWLCPKTSRATPGWTRSRRRLARLLLPGLVDDDEPHAVDRGVDHLGQPSRTSGAVVVAPDPDDEARQGLELVEERHAGPVARVHDDVRALDRAPQLRRHGARLLRDVGVGHDDDGGAHAPTLGVRAAGGRRRHGRRRALAVPGLGGPDGVCWGLPNDQIGDHSSRRPGPAPRKRTTRGTMPQSESQKAAEAADAVATQANQWADGFGRLATRCLQIILVVVVPSGWSTRYRAEPRRHPRAARLDLRLGDLPRRLAAPQAPRPVDARDLDRPDRRARRARPRRLAVVCAVQNQASQLVAQAQKGIDSAAGLHNDAALPDHDEQIESVRDTVVNFITSASSGTAPSRAPGGGSFATGLALFIVVLFFFMKDGPHLGVHAAPLPRRAVRPRPAHRRQDGLDARRLRPRHGDRRRRRRDRHRRRPRHHRRSARVPLAVIVFLSAFIPLVGATAAGILAALVALVANGPVAPSSSSDRRAGQPARGQSTGLM